MKAWLIIAFSIIFISCYRKQSYLFLRSDNHGHNGYVNSKGDVVIPFGKYETCFTDTFKKFAVVENPGTGLVIIDKAEKVISHVFVFDNGPDYLSDGYFRIVKSGKIGYMDSTFSIKIQPQFSGAYPFVNGLAKVTGSCKTVTDGEHQIWVSDNWYYINKEGKKVKN